MSTTSRVSHSSDGVAVENGGDTGVTLDAALQALSPDAQGTLAEVSEAPDRLVELVLGLLPYDSRDVLLEYGIVEPTQAFREGQTPDRLSLTRFGRRVIEACAADRDPVGLEVDAEDLQRRAQRLSQRVRSSDLPMRTREARA